MDYENFKETLLEQVRAGLPDDLCPVLTTVPKSNGELREGITLHIPGKQISPVIYVADMYKCMENGTAINDIAEKIVSILNTDVEAVDPDEFTDYSRVKNQLTLRLISKKLNTEILKSVPYEEWNDLALICNISKVSGDTAMTAKVTSGLLNYWGISKETLFADAKANSPTIAPLSVFNMIEMLKGKIGEIPGVDFSRLPSMYVVTSHSGQHGAACITYEGVLSGLAQILNSSLALIPSSVHEFIVLPSGDVSDLEPITEMVNAVNAQEVPAGEVLSDHGYFYDRETGLLSY